jgi:archaellum component FlaC
MISSEDKDIIMEGNLVIHKKAISSRVLEEELNRMYEEASDLQEIFERLSKLGVPVEDLLEDVRSALAEMERIRSNVDENSFLEIYSIKREINEIKDYLRSIFTKPTSEEGREKAEQMKVLNNV